MTTAIMIVAHPDDDALFGGPFQRAFAGYSWHVVSATYSADHPRGRELCRWQRMNGCEDVTFLDLPDDPDDYECGVSSFSPECVFTRLQRLDLSADLCVTHNPHGEYGHPHHVVVGKAVRRWAASRAVPVLEFGFGLETVDFTIEVADFFDAAAGCFASQAHLLQAHHAEDGLCRAAGYRWHVPAQGTADADPARR